MDLRYYLLKLLFISFFPLISTGQSPLYSNVLVSDVGSNNNIGRANTSRNLAIANNGDIYVVFTGSMGIRVAKSSDRGQTFAPSVQVSSINSEPEIAINDDGDIFIAWIFNETVMFSRSIDGGLTFTPSVNLGPGSGAGVTGGGLGGVHITTYGDSIFLIDEVGKNIYANNNRGSGEFTHTIRDISYVYADIRTDQNGIIYAPSDNPNLFLFKSEDNGLNYTELPPTPPGQVFFSSYALSDGPCGTFIFVGGGGGDASVFGYKIDVDTGETSLITLGNNAGDNEGRTLFADNRGTLIDGYKTAAGELVMTVSPDQGQTFGTPIVITSGGSHNIDRNPFYEDINVVYDKDGQVYLSVYNNLLKNLKISQTVFSPLCSGDNLDIPFTLSGIFDSSTEFKVYLSDAFGNFENKVLIGALTTNSNGVINCLIPDNLPYSESYKLVIESEENCSQSNIVTLSIGAIPLNQLTTLSVCDNDNDGFFSFNTSNIEDEVLQQLPPSVDNIVVEYFDGNGNPLPRPFPNSYTNIVQYIEEINIRVSTPQANCFSETKLVLEIFDTPIINKPNDVFGCNEGEGFSTFDTSNIESQLIGNQSGLIVYYLDENDEIISDFLSQNFKNSRAWSQNIKVRIENENNTMCVSETSFNLLVNELPQIDLEEDYLLCDLEPFLSLTTDSTLDSWEWVYEDGTIVSNTFEANLANAGTYRLDVGKIENGIMCENSFSFKVFRSELPRIIDINIKELSDDNFIEILASGDGDFEYSIDGFNYNNNNTFYNVQGGVYTVSVRDKFGCGDDEQEIILLDYPKYFTPNGDGIHDTWQIRGLQKFPGAITFIYDRYGKLVKQISDKSLGWDGTYNGRKLPVSDYWFVTRLTNERELTGHFALKR